MAARPQPLLGASCASLASALATFLLGPPQSFGRGVVTALCVLGALWFLVLAWRAAREPTKRNNPS